ncbi:hypothetical protein KOAAANKH_00726 [Brevundimonas sp. NIBR10]|uniref:P-type conjugative transfer protein TrbG n=1 Tax=Brevundimonas sp. NIBR10 TaxID=3015997 RepID=UPI0022F199B3|nr:P-type conjugative transfer protein TrbG [Brevundimonas sp. NIBR10]WGM45862.1 hypothetical protein KOAAANKH_00726 [Brevundimonas sp. NIBR10]
MSRPLLPSLAILTMASLGACASAQLSGGAAPLVPATLVATSSVVVASADPAAPGGEEPVTSAPVQPPAPPTLDPPAPDLRDPTDRIARANAAARVEPTRDGYANAMQVYAFDEGALFQVYAAPGQITDIALQPGESLSASGPVAAGDTARWIIGDTLSGSGAEARVHILVKPTRPDLRTNLIINTDRRTYHLDLRSTASTAMTSVSWRYPQDALIALRVATARQAARAAEPTLSVDALSFDYRISGANAAWRPVRAFDDGRQVILEFGPGLDASTLPPLFVRSDDGRSADLVNYRIAGRRLVVDRLFDIAELRLAGPHGREQVVRIEKTGRATR